MVRVLRPYKIPRAKNSQLKPRAKKIDHYMMNQSMKDQKELNEERIRLVSYKTGIKACLVEEMTPRRLPPLLREDTEEDQGLLQVQGAQQHEQGLHHAPCGLRLQRHPHEIPSL